MLVVLGLVGFSSALLSVHFFFFSSRRRHTRLQGDWSSDVCSSDLGDRLAKRAVERVHGAVPLRRANEPLASGPDLDRRLGLDLSVLELLGDHPEALRSEERRVGKECRSRWSPYH